MENADGSQALFQSVGRDGSDLRFVVRSDGSWAIMRNGNEVGRGTSRQASIDGGVRKFMSLTRVIASSAAACDPVIGPLLDRIERGDSSPAKIAKDQPMITRHASVSA